MKRFLIVIFSLLIVGFSSVFGQCLQIESILADACGNPEGANEMVRFKVGADDLNAADIVFDWPNNTFLGWCPEPTKTAQLNATILSSCGWILEPTNDLLPADATVVAISSTSFDVNANSFEGLSDTIYVLYQCTGNTSGHFSNSASSTRTLIINVSGSCNGSDNASYVGTNLIGGDGAAIEYTSNSLTYVNNGCNAPFPELNANWNLPDTLCSNYGQIELTNFVNEYNPDFNYSWTATEGVNQTSFDPSNLYGPLTINLTVSPQNGCLETADSAIVIFVDSVGTKLDTITVCDSLLYNGSWVTEDGFISLSIDASSPFTCSGALQRYVIIERAEYALFPTYVEVTSNQPISFEVINADNNLEVSWTNTIGDFCNNDCLSAFQVSDPTTVTFALEDASNGCIALADLEVMVNYYSEINIPNIFTPNNDGFNDNLELFGNDIFELDWQVYDRFGGLVFRSNSLTDSWDGLFNGQQVSSGIYLLNLKAIGKDGQRLEKTIKINLVR